MLEVEERTSRQLIWGEIGLLLMGVGEHIDLAELGAGEPRSETVHTRSAAGVAVSDNEKSTRYLKEA